MQCAHTVYPKIDMANVSSELQEGNKNWTATKKAAAEAINAPIADGFKLIAVGREWFAAACVFVSVRKVWIRYARSRAHNKVKACETHILSDHIKSGACMLNNDHIQHQMQYVCAGSVNDSVRIKISKCFCEHTLIAMTMNVCASDRCFDFPYLAIGQTMTNSKIQTIGERQFSMLHTAKQSVRHDDSHHSTLCARTVCTLLHWNKQAREEAKKKYMRAREKRTNNQP